MVRSLAASRMETACSRCAVLSMLASHNAATLAPRRQRTLRQRKRRLRLAAVTARFVCVDCAVLHAVAVWLHLAADLTLCSHARRDPPPMPKGGIFGLITVNWG